jgi:glycosyltransferase involved in cell wall biosynthesis
MARIAFVDVTATVSYGGVQTAVWQLAMALHDAGHEVAVLGGAGSVSTDFGGRGIRVYQFPFRSRARVVNFGTRFRKMVERISFARAARRQVVEGAYDWVILTKPFDFFWPWLMPKASQTRFAFMSGGTDFFVGDKWLSRKIEAWMACSYFNAWQIKSRYGSFPQVIYNGVDTDAFSPQAQRPANRQELEIPAVNVVFGFAGRLVGWKGVDVAIMALARPEMQDIPSSLLVIGAGPHEGRLKGLANDLGVAARVTFVGAVAHERLPAIYASIDVGVFPSIADEAFGITIAEAMSCGKPVIASHIGGIPEVVGNEGSAGLLVAPADDKALATAMRQLADNPSRRAEMGQVARQRIQNNYTWRLAATRLLTALSIDAPDLR